MSLLGGTSGRKPEAEFTIGSSVNAAVAAFSKCLADLGKQDGVQVNCVHPSLVETERQWKRIRAEVAATGDSEADVRKRFVKKMGFIRYGKVEEQASLALQRPGFDVAIADTIVEAAALIPILG